MRVTVDFEPREGFTGLEAAAEVLFNFGIGEPEDGEPWINMAGQAYIITDYKVGVSS